MNFWEFLNENIFWVIIIVLVLGSFVLDVVNVIVK